MSMPSGTIKRAGATSEFDDFRISELEKCMDDPIYFMENYVYVQHPKLGSVQFKLYDFQKDMVRLMLESRFSIVLCARQLGKTTVSAVFLLWVAIFKPDQTILIASKGMAHAIEIMDRIRGAYEGLPEWLVPGCRYYNRSSIEFDNSSRIISQATTEKTGRGFSISLLYMDELAFTNKRIQEMLWSSLFPTLSTGGSCIISSTPNGDSDLFATLWRGAELGTNDFKPFQAIWSAHPDRDESWKKMMVGSIGELLFRQECCNDFLSSDPLLISSIKMSTMKTFDHIKENGLFRWWKDIDQNKSYVVGCDVASGTGSDYSAINVIEFPSLIQVAELRSNTLSIPQLYGRLKWIVNYIATPSQGAGSRGRAPEVFWSWENNGLGHALIALYQNDENPPAGELISADPKQLGVNTNSKTKIISCLKLKSLVEKMRGNLQINSNLLLAELKNYVSAGGSYAAKPGATDDLISSILVCIQIIKKMSEFDETAFKITHAYDEVNGDIDEDGNMIEDDADANEPFGIF